MRIPTATYRIQVNALFPLRAVRNTVEYLSGLGVSDLYLSPLLAASPGSLHGYDIVDFTRINPEIGTESDLQELVEKLKDHRMGLILDFVPNHMCITSPLNRWWWDVLKYGKDSDYREYFDIDRTNKVVLPFLAESLDDAIENGSLVIQEEEEELCLNYYSMSFPTDPQTHVIVDDLRGFIEAQHYRLAYWKEGSQQLNYRRFFTINELACLRVENFKVFADVHQKIFEWINNGWVTGLRIDHIDGLADPKGYCNLLRDRYPDLFLITEKILMNEEQLPRNWKVEGTTGYDFLNLMNGVFVDDKKIRHLLDAYARLTGVEGPFTDIVATCKDFLLRTEMQAEWKTLLSMLSKHCREYPAEIVASALAAFIISFPRYRTYFSASYSSEEDREIVRQTLDASKELNPSVPDSLWQQIEQMFDESFGPFAIRFQQTTGAVMAKGWEDTALYRYFPLLSLNEVGASALPDCTSVEAFHRENQRRCRLWPHTLLASTTHDTKRSEDVRARIHVIGEIPQIWEKTVLQWREWNLSNKIDGAPTDNDEYLLYQTLVGTWPTQPMKRKQFALYVDRIKSYMQKAIKEAKCETSWVEPNEEYEYAMQQFIQRILVQHCPFIADLDTFVLHIAQCGINNALSQMLLKIASPGIPDIYQGAESWVWTLVDPDNRHPVDFAALKKLESRPISEEAVKFSPTRKALNYRKQQSDLFLEGEYIPLEVIGTRERNAIAFSREYSDKRVIVLAGRFWTELSGDDPWKETAIVLDEGDRPLHNLFTDSIIRPKKRNGQWMLALSEGFEGLPISMLEQR
ncbi:MAG: malto-oligosyltrehalose synthase [Waddliaceae bacterium]